MSVLTTGFDTDTALEAVGDGVWRGAVHARWFITSGPNGGFVAALAARAMILATGRPPRSLTLHYLEAPREGPIEVACSVEREGRATTSIGLRLSQDGRPVGLGLGACAELRDDQPEWDDAARPDVPPPDACKPFDPERPGVPPFFRNWEMRWPGGPSLSERPARLGGWMRPIDARPLDAVVIAAMTDAWMPPAFTRMPERLFVPTIDLTIHWRAPLPAGGHPWVLGVFTTRLAAGGVCEEDGELWSEDGVLLAQSRQLAIVRRRTHGGPPAGRLRDRAAGRQAPLG